MPVERCHGYCGKGKNEKIIIDNSTIICYTLVNNNLYGGQNEENYK